MKESDFFDRSPDSLYRTSCCGWHLRRLAQLLRSARDEVEQDASDQNRKKETLAIRRAPAAGVENIIMFKKSRAAARVSRTPDNRAVAASNVHGFQSHTQNRAVFQRIEGFRVDSQGRWLRTGLAVYLTEAVAGLSSVLPRIGNAGRDREVGYGRSFRDCGI